jgi:hypothetical protein
MYGIITGDIINSRRIDAKAREYLYAALQQFLKTLQAEGWLKKVEQTGGDSFQCEVVDVKQVLRIALMIKCFVKANTITAPSSKQADATKKTLPATANAGVRIAASIGGVDFMKKKLSASDGEAFILASEALANLKTTYSELALQTSQPLLNASLAPTIVLLDALAQKYFGRQAAVILQKLQFKKEEEVAAIMGISQPGVNQAAKSAQWYAVEIAVKYIEDQITLAYAS